MPPDHGRAGPVLIRHPIGAVAPESGEFRSGERPTSGPLFDLCRQLVKNLSPDVKDGGPRLPTMIWFAVV
jgi:hypothetical protein